MKSYSTLISLYQSYTNNTDSTNVTLGAQLINDGYRLALGKKNWPFLEKVTNINRGFSLTGTADPDGTTTLVGTSTLFTVEVSIGDYITVNSENRRVTAIASNTSLTVDTAFSDTASGATVTCLPLFRQLPFDSSEVSSVYVTVSNVRYDLKEAPSNTFWNNLNFQTYTSDIPEFYFIQNGKIGIFPYASTSTNAISIVSKRVVKDLGIADYTTGGVQSLTNGAFAVVGTGTTWTASMVGRYLRITESDTANKGDGFWYEIGSYSSATAITILKPYGGTSISAGNAAYIIGQVPLLPENYQMMPVWYAVAEYWDLQGENETSRAQVYRNKFNEAMKQMEEEFSNKTTNYVIDYGEPYTKDNPNLHVRL